jgi:glycosyltransferase involved in cell wall biosynthesis
MRRQMGERDLHYAFINYASMLAADRIFFNSEFHRQSFFAALPAFLNHYPEYKEVGTIRTLLARSAVLHIGLELQWLEHAATPGSLAQEPPLVLWNQRWEYDKNPEAFFDALYRLDADGIGFRLALCGQQFGRQPPSFAQAIERLAPRIIHAGYARQNHYRRLLREATVTVSTAEHEFFGISILEAIAAHTLPLLPARLSYPELIATEFHPGCLYSNQEQLVERLRWALLHRQEAEGIASRLAATIGRFDWRRLALDYDEALEQVRK